MDCIQITKEQYETGLAARVVCNLRIRKRYGTQRNYHYFFYESLSELEDFWAILREDMICEGEEDVCS